LLCVLVSLRLCSASRFCRDDANSGQHGGAMESALKICGTEGTSHGD
jgi:hypothetical protein